MVTHLLYSCSLTISISRVEWKNAFCRDRTRGLSNPVMSASPVWSEMRQLRVMVGLRQVRPLLPPRSPLSTAALRFSCGSSTNQQPSWNAESSVAMLSASTSSGPGLDGTFPDLLRIFLSTTSGASRISEFSPALTWLHWLMPCH